MNETNQVRLVGVLAEDPVFNIYESGHRVILRVATDNSEGAFAGSRPQTTWHNVVAWDSMADRAAKDFKKGSRVSVTGRLVYRKYKGKDQVERLGVDVRAIELEEVAA
jgi:single-strand DNA-binding protein